MTANATKKKTNDSILWDNGYYAYCCSSGGKYALHNRFLQNPESYVATFKTKRDAIEYAIKNTLIETK